MRKNLVSGDFLSVWKCVRVSDQIKTPCGDCTETDKKCFQDDFCLVSSHSAKWLRITENGTGPISRRI